MSNAETIPFGNEALANTPTLEPRIKPTPDVLIISPYPPRQCGIASYSQDLEIALKTHFSRTFGVSVCALEATDDHHEYPAHVEFILEADNPNSYDELADQINRNEHIHSVILQHEFGLYHTQEPSLLRLVSRVSKPIIITFHTVLPEADAPRRRLVRELSTGAASVVVMTQGSKQMLTDYYGVPAAKIAVITHGTHLRAPIDKPLARAARNLENRKILSTFGLLSANKSIETTLQALPAIIEKHPDVLFMVIGTLHPVVLKREGTRYRDMLDALVESLSLQDHVRFIDAYLPVAELLEYLQLTDIYLFTSNDPNQAVSGTFVYALSCGCAIVSTRIPHAVEMLTDDTGLLIDFASPGQLSEAVNTLLDDEGRTARMRRDVLRHITPSNWPNAAIAHARVIAECRSFEGSLRYDWPAVNLDHFKRLTTAFGMIQFANGDQPDLASGYTLDDNARALIAVGQYYQLEKDERCLTLMDLYLRFIEHCVQPSGDLLNYVDETLNFTSQNQVATLDDANGRAAWALGFVVSLDDVLPAEMTAKANAILQRMLPHAATLRAPRSMAFILKGLYYRNLHQPSADNVDLIRAFAERLNRSYIKQQDGDWHWFEDELTYANSLLPEAMLCAWLVTGEALFKEVAVDSLDFLMRQTFTAEYMRVISNRTWLHKHACLAELPTAGEQPIDVAYTVMTLSRFYDALGNETYHDRMMMAFDWFQGRNQARQIIYNPRTGGCYDGIEEHGVNLNQGAESTVCYLMARLAVERYAVPVEEA